MNSAPNPFQEPLSSLFKRLDLLLGLLLILKNATSARREQAEKMIERRFASNRLFAGARLAISDLTYWPEGGWRETFPSEGYWVSGEEFLDALDHSLTRNSGWTVSQGYEAFETFLFDVAAMHLHLHPDQVDAALRQKFDRKAGKRGVDPTQPSYWRQLVRTFYRGDNNDRIFSLLRNFAPDIATTERENNRQLDLPDWYLAVSEVRHAVTHADFVVKPERIREWPLSRKTLLLDFVLADHRRTEAGYQIQLDYKKAEQTLQRFAEYAFAIFNSLSVTSGYDWDTRGQRKAGEGKS